jgi:hypothetical protein
MDWKRVIFQRDYCHDYKRFKNRSSFGTLKSGQQALYVCADALINADIASTC